MKLKPEETTTAINRENCGLYEMGQAGPAPRPAPRRRRPAGILTWAETEKVSGTFSGEKTGSGKEKRTEKVPDTFSVSSRRFKVYCGQRLSLAIFSFVDVQGSHE